MISENVHGEDSSCTPRVSATSARYSCVDPAHANVLLAGSDEMDAPKDTSVDLVVRFSTSNPDLILSIAHASSISGLSLKQRIRARLPAPASESKLRLIHAGKVIPDTIALSKSLNVTIPPPPRDDEIKSVKGKGKQPIRDAKVTAARVYIHCSIGDALTPSELAEEADAAKDADATLASKTQSVVTGASTSIGPQNASTTTPAPRGFDRLLNAGFTQAEVATLHTQFLAIQAHTHTPDTMPTGPDLLALEERWLDSGSNTATAGTDDTGGFGSEDAGGLEDMLYGNLIGFFWPVGAMCWLMREEGVWSRRRQIAVLSGFLVNLTFGFLRLMN